MDSLDELLSRLKTTSSSVERNALAIEAAETGEPKVLLALIELIDWPEFVNERGTLIHCLANFDCSRHFLRLVRLVCYGNWEVAHEAMGVLEKMDNVEGEEVKQGYDLLLMTVDAGVNDEWRAKLLADLLSKFD